MPTTVAAHLPDRFGDREQPNRGSVLTAPPFGFSPELPLRRPGGPTARPALSVPELIQSSLRRLRGLHVRLSLCRVSLRQGSDGRLTAIDDPYLIAAPARDGALIVVFIHPADVTDDVLAEQALCQRLVDAFYRQRLPLWALRYSCWHCDAAAVDEGAASFDVLLSQPPQPLRPSSLGRTA
ncbi:MAG TPA: hypothetical protein EYH07_15255 [Kiloniellaceae bacterium]|nr:hypothetical protein [Kiloniellaceae bacterium]